MQQIVPAKTRESKTRLDRDDRLLAVGMLAGVYLGEQVGTAEAVRRVRGYLAGQRDEQAVCGRIGPRTRRRGGAA